ncbi:hypothetical protein R3W88_029194 [Solanum pinnatisectum]|uniref:Uncharacterized protein n=1 Tax=Solanum pinnatisectum TaxID=50273 RepID=A0AAV9K4L6_9SOLN|nr:hypothetical protein R3W88_029194 [Solanum pinnatisectum]
MWMRPFGRLRQSFRADILSFSTFQVHDMCAKVGVDPLVSNKGFWAELLAIRTLAHASCTIVYKTVAEVWSEIHKTQQEQQQNNGCSIQNTGNGSSTQRQATFGEIV